MSSLTKRIFKALCVLTVLSFILVGSLIYDAVKVLANTSSTRSKNIYELETRLGTVKTERSKLEKQIAADEKELASVEQEIKLIDEEIALLTEQSYIIDSLYEEWSSVSEESKALVTTYEEQVDYELESFDSMLRMSYMHGDDTYFALIFGSEDIGDFLARTDMLAYHFQARDNVVTNLSNSISNLNLAIEQYDDSLVQLGVFEEEQRIIKETLLEREAYATQRKSELQNNIEANEKLLSDKKSELSDIESSLKVLYEEQKKLENPPVYTGNGKFAIPTTNYRITSGFVNRISPITGKPEKHNGLDLAAPGGTPIYAAEAGTVIDSRYSSSWGNVIQIDHGSGIVTLYAHCSQRIAQKGQVVQKGELIARVGTTGWSTGNHLHFTVYVGGVAVDPRPYLGI